jgi:hypothetical protein
MPAPGEVLFGGSATRPHAQDQEAWPFGHGMAAAGYPVVLSVAVAAWKNGLPALVACFSVASGVEALFSSAAWEAEMTRFVVVVCSVLASGAVVAGPAAADPQNPHASCEGILVSSASYPGQVADLGRAFHDALKEQGIPPGVLDVGAAQLKEGSVEGCLVALPS